MNPIQAKLKIYTYSLSILAALNALLYFFCYYFCFDSELHYFSTATPLPAIAKAVLILSLLWAASALIFIPRDQLKTTSPAYSVGSTFGTTLCGFAFLFFSALDALTAYRVGILYADRRTKILVLLAVISGFLTAIYFLAGTSPKFRRRDWRLFLGFFTILWAISTLAIDYFDFTHPMNEPVKVSLMLAMICVMITVLAEIRTMLDLAQPRLCLFAHFVSMLILSVSGPALILVAPRTEVMADYRRTVVIITALLCYVFFRTHDMLRNQLAPDAEESEDAA